MLAAPSPPLPSLFGQRIEARAEYVTTGAEAGEVAAAVRLALI